MAHLSKKTVKAYGEDWGKFPAPWKDRFVVLTKGVFSSDRDVMKAVLEDSEELAFASAIGGRLQTRQITSLSTGRILATLHFRYD